MKYLVMLVVDDMEKCPSLFEAWEAAGVSGITIFESTGLGRIRRAFGYRDDLPLMPSLRNLMQSREAHHRTLLALVREEAMIDRLIEATESILGNLNEPDTGILFALPVARVHGIGGWQEGESDE